MACPYNDFFTPSCALGYNLSPLTGLEKSFRRLPDLIVTKH
jgi:hypothetical protein